LKIICDIYCRVSTTEQAESGYSIGEQENRLRKFAEAQGWLINQCYLDGGFSGASLNRPGIQSVIMDAEQKKIDKIVVYKLDRLSRSQKDTLHLIEDVFLKNDVDFVSMTESLDTSTPFGMAMIGILSVFAQLERETIKERMNIGKNARIRSGKYRGSGHIPIGFTYSDGELHIDEYESMIIRNLFEEYASGATASSLAVWLNNQIKFRKCKWSAEKVKKLLTQPLYIGLQRWHGEEFEVENCPKIVSEELWSAVQKEIQRRTAKNVIQPQSPYKHTTLLGGLLWCGCCGQRYSAMSDRDSKGNKVHRYYCYGRILKNHHYNAEPCNNRSWKAEELNDIVLGELRKLTLDNALIDERANESAINSMLENQRAINSRLEQIEEQINRIIDLYSLGTIDASTISKKIEKLKAEKENLYQQLEEIKKPTGALNRKEIALQLRNFSDLIDSVGSDKMKLYSTVHQLIHSITLTNDEIKIMWNFEV